MREKWYLEIRSGFQKSCASRVQKKEPHNWMEQVDTAAYLLYTLKAGSIEVYQALSVVCRAYTDSSS